jgi:hypothetical protein
MEAFRPTAEVDPFSQQFRSCKRAEVAVSRELTSAGADGPTGIARALITRVACANDAAVLAALLSPMPPISASWGKQMSRPSLTISRSPILSWMCVKLRSTMLQGDNESPQNTWQVIGLTD